MVCKPIPLKNVGFQINKGANPHFTKIAKRIINQIRPKVAMSFTLFVLIKYKNICSIRNQSNVKTLK